MGADGCLEHDGVANLGLQASHFEDAHAANVTYLKIDGGDHPCSATALAKKLAPLMAVEHAIGNGPIGDDPYLQAVPNINRSDTCEEPDVAVQDGQFIRNPHVQPSLGDPLPGIASLSSANCALRTPARRPPGRTV